MSFAKPDLAARIGWYQDRLRPEDTAFGNGIADWTITSEYDDDPQSEGGTGPIWGCMCSPSILASEGRRVKLQPADIATKQAHIIVRTPKSEADIDEIERTILHELGHVLVAPMKSENREAEENAMHSLDHFFSKTKLSPEQGAILARSFQNPMARAYRATAKEGDMPDPIEDDKKPDKEAPKMQEGAPRDVATIQGDIAKAALAGQPVDELAKELALALVAAGSAAGNGPASIPPPEPPTMGMNPEEAYARGKREAESAAEAKAVKAFATSIEGITEEQRAEIADAPSMERASRLLRTYPRQAQGATLGLPKGQVPAARQNAGGLASVDASAMARQMGAKNSKIVGPHIQTNGRFSMGSMTPTQLRNAIAVGKDPRNEFPSTMGAE